MSYISLAEKTSILSKLIQLAKSDGMVSPSEVTYLFWMAQKLEITQGELQRLFTETVPHEAPIGLSDRVLQFHKCLNIITLDAEITQEEFQLCLQVANQFGLPEHKTLSILHQLSADCKAFSEEDILAAYAQ